MKLAFYAPMKAPDDPVPSGDRTMARNIMQAFELAGHEMSLVSRLKGRLGQPEQELLEARRRQGAAECNRIAGEWRVQGRCDAVVCYHVYYKCPDFIGPQLAHEFGVPYITFEASYAGKRDRDEWAAAQAIASAAIRQAALNVAFTPRDLDGLLRLVPEDRAALVPPFIDMTAWTRPPAVRPRAGPVELVSVAMMVKGNKMTSFRQLADGLRLVDDLDWRLMLVGDGAQRSAVAEMFAGFREGRVQFAGACDQSGVREALHGGDIFAWPGYREAFGVAYLEAQAAGLPVVATRSGGVASAVSPGETALLADENDVNGFAGGLRRLITDTRLRTGMAARAAQFIRSHRSLEAAASRLDALLGRAIESNRREGEGEHRTPAT